MSISDVNVSDGLAGKPIKHFMKKKVVYATTTTTVEMAMTMLVNHDVSGLPVLDGRETCVGVYSELDAILQASSQPMNSPIKFGKPLLSVKPETTFREVLILMASKRIKRLPVVDGRQKLLGVVSRRDLMKALLSDAIGQKN